MPQSNQNSTVTAGAWLAIFSGLWMLVGNTWMSSMHWDTMSGGMMHSMRPFVWHEHYMGYFPGMGWPFPGIFAGFAMLAFGVLLYAAPAQRVAWGILIILTAVLVLTVSMGGLIPGLLGIVGGALAVVPSGTGAGTPPPSDTSPTD